jgi:hypothetical protein
MTCSGAFWEASGYTCGSGGQRYRLQARSGNPCAAMPAAALERRSLTDLGTLPGLGMCVGVGCVFGLVQCCPERHYGRFPARSAAA